MQAAGPEKLGTWQGGSGLPCCTDLQPINVLSLEFLFWLSGQSRQMWAALPLGLTPSRGSGGKHACPG